MDDKKTWLKTNDAFSLVSGHYGDDFGVVSLLRKAKNGEISISAQRWHYTRENDLKTYDLCSNESDKNTALRLDFVRLLHDIEAGSKGGSIWGTLSTCCHKLGDYEIEDYTAKQPLNGWHSVSGLCFCREEIVSVFGLMESNAETKIHQSKSKGGRSLIHRHSYAAAQVTLELIKLPKDQRTNITLASISAMLEPHYQSKHPKHEAPGNDILRDSGRDIKEAIAAYWESRA